MRVSPQIEDIDKMARDVPAMPVVAQKVMTMLGDENTTNSMLADVLSTDQSLASRILQMANSPFFGTRQKIASISNAVFVLGHSALQSLVITVCTKGLFKNPGLVEEKLWEHSLAVAVASKQIAGTTGLQEPDEAFVAGLLHDIGRTSYVVVYRDAHRDIAMRAYNDDLSMEEIGDLEKEEFGYDHSEVGSRVLKVWRLPDVYSRVARRHHATSVDLIEREENPQAIAIVGQANLIAGRLGLGRAAPDKRIDVIATPYNGMLGLDRDHVLKVVEATLTTFKETRDQFGLPG